MLDCDLEVSGFELQLCYFVQFRTYNLSYEPTYFAAMGQIAPPLFSNVSFGIKLLTKVDMPLNKETEAN